MESLKEAIKPSVRTAVHQPRVVLSTSGMQSCSYHKMLLGYVLYVDSQQTFRRNKELCLLPARCWFPAWIIVRH
jgi:hypothetical protein